ncbi:CapA family protein [Kineococcus gynurae]|uniref:CapA family protein n=1 Tax=Kineococcus gynurae TaxID=452979 RepID=A0ABV5LMU5_9ACTN
MSRPAGALAGAFGGAFALALPLVLTACGGGDPAPAAPPPVTVAVAGDVNAAGAAAAALDPDGLAAITPALSAADVTLVNVETAITERGTPAAKQFTFRAPPTLLERLRAAGVDVAAMANNHSLDYGVTGLRDTLAAARSTSMPVIGLGEDVGAASAPWRTTVRGHRLSVFAATQVLDGNLAASWTAGEDKPGLAAVNSADGQERLVAAVRAERARADSVVVVLHWGKELDACPLPRQEELADALVAAGADAVVGSHAHRLLGNGYRSAGGRTGFVDYGLGNFVFAARSAATTATGVLTLTLQPGRAPAARWTPATIEAGVPVPLAGAEADAALAARDELRSCTDLRAAP